MTDTTPNQPLFQLERVYVSGISLEIPKAPEVFLTQGEIQVNFSVLNTPRQLADDTFDVKLDCTLTATLEGKIIYLVEMQQNGIFRAQHIPKDALLQLLEVHAPAVLTGYLRANLSDVLTRATLPMFFLPEIDWARYFHEHQADKPTGKLH